jgi:hypothetical protein
MNLRVSLAVLAFVSSDVWPGAQAAAPAPVAAASEDLLDSPIKPVKPSTATEMAMRFFQDALRPYGEWIEISGYGSCWKPKVDARWMPYTLGHWGYSDAGWTWISDEKFGGVVFHYGRWLHTSTDGWCWVPGLDWAGAWVSWRYGTEHIGWAPLPPQATWQPEIGIAPWADREYSIGPNHFRFCLIGNAADPKLSQLLLPVSENVDRIRRTVNTTNISAYGRGIFCGGPAFDWVGSRSRGSFRFLELIREPSWDQYRARLQEAGEDPGQSRGLVRGQKHYLLVPNWQVLTEPRKAIALGYRTDDVAVVGKKAEEWREGDTEEMAGLKAQEEELVRKAAAEAKRKAAGKAFVLSGWEGIADDGSRGSLRSKIAREVHGMTPDNTRAKRVDPDLDFPRRDTAVLR